MTRTWFLPPDFTFTTDGPLRLGMVISHWSRPNSVLAEVGAGTAAHIKLPNITSIVEQNHNHTRSQSRSSGFAIFSKFLDVASVSASHDRGKSTNTDYSKTEHEIRFFSDPLTPETLAAVANLPAVRNQMKSGIFGLPRRVYFVSGLRIATSSFTVTTGNSSNQMLETEMSGPPAGAIPVEIGGKLKHGSERMITDSYDTAPGVVFAYRLHVIRTDRTYVLTHNSAFLTGPPKPEDESLVLAAADKNEIEEDIDEPVNYEFIEFGDEVCIMGRTQGDL